MNVYVPSAHAACYRVMQVRQYQQLLDEQDEAQERARPRPHYQHDAGPLARPRENPQSGSKAFLYKLVSNGWQGMSIGAHARSPSLRGITRMRSLSRNTARKQSVFPRTKPETEETDLSRKAMITAPRIYATYRQDRARFMRFMFPRGCGKEEPSRNSTPLINRYI